MNKIKTVIFLIGCISSIHLVIGQYDKDTIFFSKDEIVRKIHSTDNYIGIKVDNKKSLKAKGVLYNMSGEKILEFEEDTNRILDFIPNELYNQIILINKIWVYPVRYKDEIVAIDIDSGSINWKVRSIASEYLVSPDGKYLLTESNVAGYEIKNEFEVINLMDGSILLTNLELGENYYANWLDNQRVVIYAPEWEIIKNDKYFKEEEGWNQEKRKVHKEKADLYFKLKKDSISKEDFDAQYQAYNDKLDSINKDHATKTRLQPHKVGDEEQEQFVGRPYSFEIKSIYFILYNVVTKTIELEKKYNPDDNIISNIRYNPMGTISIDNEKNIYVLDYKDRFHQLDNNLNVKWSVEMERPYSIYKVIKSDSIFFVVDERKKTEYSIISKNGTKRNLSDTDDLVANKKIDKNSRSKVIDLRTGLEYNNEKNFIKLRNK